MWPKTLGFGQCRFTPKIPLLFSVFTHSSTTRYYGAYSSRTRSVQKKQSTNNSSPESTSTLIPCALEPQSIRKASKSWASLIKRVFEIDPLICPKCSSTMRVVSFITNSNEINRLLKNLGIPAWTIPEPIKSNAPPSTEPSTIPYDEWFSLNLCRLEKCQFDIPCP